MKTTTGAYRREVGSRGTQGSGASPRPTKTTTGAYRREVGSRGTQGSGTAPRPIGVGPIAQNAKQLQGLFESRKAENAEELERLRGMDISALVTEAAQLLVQAALFNATFNVTHHTRKEIGFLAPEKAKLPSTFLQVLGEKYLGPAVKETATSDLRNRGFPDAQIGGPRQAWEVTLGTPEKRKG